MTKPLIIAHRGDIVEAPESTLPAFAGARPTDLLSGETLPPIPAESYHMSLERAQFRWLKL